MLAPDLLLWMLLCCTEYNTDPAIPLAVMKMESNFKVGPLGKKGTFIGPGGIHKMYRSKWDIDDPKENIRIVVRAFSNKRTEPQIIARLKTYNKTWWKDNYIRDVMRTYRQYRRKG